MNLIFKIDFSDGICPNQKSISGICSRLNCRELQHAVIECLYNDDLSENDFVVSNVMPFLGEDYYIEKPAFISKGLLNLSLADHKFHRFMKYLNLKDIECFYQGHYDFVANSKISFGQYVNIDGKDYFEFSKEAGLYFLLQTKQPLLLRTSEAIFFELEHVISNYILPNRSNVHVFSVVPDELWNTRLNVRGDGPVLTLTDINTLDLSSDCLEAIMDGASYQVSYNKNKQGIVLRAGAYILRPSLILNRAICINI